jgi:hypothetical protein
MVAGVSDEERDLFAARLKIGFVLLVGVSGGLITTYGGVGWTGVLVAVCVSATTGAVLVWLVFPDRGDLARANESRSRRERR